MAGLESRLSESYLNGDFTKCKLRWYERRWSLRSKERGDYQSLFYQRETFVEAKSLAIVGVAERLSVVSSVESFRDRFDAEGKFDRRAHKTSPWNKRKPSSSTDIDIKKPSTSMETHHAPLNFSFYHYSCMAHELKYYSPPKRFSTLELESNARFNLNKKDEHEQW